MEKFNTIESMNLARTRSANRQDPYLGRVVVAKRLRVGPPRRAWFSAKQRYKLDWYTKHGAVVMVEDLRGDRWCWGDWQTRFVRVQGRRSRDYRVESADHYEE